MGQQTLWKHGRPFFLLWNNKVQGLISLFVGAYFEIHKFIDGVDRAHGYKQNGRSELKGLRRKILR
jgi:hypothetical protein